ncbi:MAG: LPD38 domain-containing protein [Sulfurisoma sp.]|nr:LPD38 domain-containing protein [Sulfurisoma sp.]
MSKILTYRLKLGVTHGLRKKAGKDGKVEFVPGQMAPTLFKMAAGPSTNIDSLGRNIAPEKYRKSMPDSANMTRALRGSSYAAISATINGWTGGNAHQPGFVDVSPNVLKYWVTSISGGAGRFVGDVADAGWGAYKGVAPD